MPVVVTPVVLKVILSLAVTLVKAVELPTVPPKTMRPELPEPKVKAEVPLIVPFKVNTSAAMLVPMVVEAEARVILPAQEATLVLTPVPIKAPLVPPMPLPFNVNGIAAAMLTSLRDNAAPLLTVTPEVNVVLPSARLLSRTNSPPVIDVAPL